MLVKEVCGLGRPSSTSEGYTLYLRISSFDSELGFEKSFNYASKLANFLSEF